MAGPFDFFTPGPWTDPQAQPMGQAISDFFADPRGRAALLQMGLTAMSPQGWGDTTSGQIARAIGSGGEAATRGEAMDIRKSEAESKQDLRAAQATTAEARAGSAGMSAELSRQRLANQAQLLDIQRERTSASTAIGQSRLYQAYREAVQKRNENVLRTGPPEKPLGLHEWKVQMGLAQAESQGDETATPTAPAVTAPRESVRVQTPAEAAGLPVGTPYVTPDGRRFTR